MRVIAGKAKGIRLKAPHGAPGLRPLTDQAREALFNILSGKVVDCHFLDLFAGTGAVGIEALSRGAEFVAFVEMSRQFVACIRENLKTAGFSEKEEVYAMEVSRALSLLERKEAQFDIIYMGAPYDSPALEEAIEKLSGTKILKSTGVLIAEHRKQHDLPEYFGDLKVFRDARYGETVLSFYENRNLSG